MQAHIEFRGFSFQMKHVDCTCFYTAAFFVEKRKLTIYSIDMQTKKICLVLTYESAMRGLGTYVKYIYL